MWIAFFVALCALGILAANRRVRFRWLLLILLGLMAFRLTQPVTYVIGEPGTNYEGKTRTDR
jgi:hypothetical protein